MKVLIIITKCWYWNDFSILFYNFYNEYVAVTVIENDIITKMGCGEKGIIFYNVSKFGITS